MTLHTEVLAWNSTSHLALAVLLALSVDGRPLRAEPGALSLKDGEGLAVGLESARSTDQLDALVKGEGHTLLLIILLVLSLGLRSVCVSIRESDATSSSFTARISITFILTETQMLKFSVVAGCDEHSEC